MSFRNGRDNRGKIFLIIATLFMWLFIISSFKYYGYEETWHIWNVPTFMPPFVDFRLIPGSTESFQKGFEPTVENPGDPGGRIFNYPIFWRIFFYSGITQDDTIWISILMILLFFFGVFLFSDRLDVSGATGMLLVIFSPAAMLLYERGNVDLIVFFLCAVIILAAEWSSYLTTGLILFGLIVKVFPLFGVTVLLRESKKRFILLGLVCLLFTLVYGYLTFKSQNIAWSNTMRGDGLSYGSFVIITKFDKYFQHVFPNLFSFGQWEMLFEALAIVLICLAGIRAVMERDSLDAAHEKNLAAFRMGASIYLGTFLLGNNWDYRLAFLVLVVPQLTQWFLHENMLYRWLAIGSLIAVLLSCWSLLLNIDLRVIPLKDPLNRIFLMDEFVNWLLVPGFSYLLIASAPAWLKDDLQKMIIVKK